MTGILRSQAPAPTSPGPRLWRGAVIALAVVLPAPAAAAPEFVTQPSDIYEQFSALKEPRADVPVGALWVQEYGPHGDGAAADNLVTVRSLSGVTLSGDLQLRLTLGLAALLNLEPGYSRRISARFSDLSIVRVKDLSKLDGPAGEPRIYEALKAATISVTTDRDLGVDVGGALTVKNLPVIARADTGGKKSFTIDGRDLFIAYSVAASLPSRGDWREATVPRGGKAAELGLRDYRLRLALLEQTRSAADAAPVGGFCAEKVAVTLLRRSDSGDGKPTVTHDFSAAGGESVSVPLPVPVADGEGGLFTTLVLRRGGQGAGGASEGPRASCPKSDLRLSARLEGQRIKKLEGAKAPGW